MFDPGSRSALLFYTLVSKKEFAFFLLKTKLLNDRLIVQTKETAAKSEL